MKQHTLSIFVFLYVVVHVNIKLVKNLRKNMAEKLYFQTHTSLTNLHGSVTGLSTSLLPPIK